MLRVTVAICTHNRAVLLAKTLANMTTVRVPADVDWELLVVNNCSSDDTEGVASGFADRLPVRLVWEGRAGLSHARNCAIDHAKGDYLVWTDDDVLVSPEWLAEYCRAFEQWPDSVVFGGPVEPWFEGDPPGWMDDSLEILGGVYALRDLGSEVTELGPGVVPYGANFAFRTAEQKQYRFDPELGRTPDSLKGGEEVELIQRALREGHEGKWIPTASVKHFIPRERQTLKYIREYFSAYGEQLARAHGLGGDAMLFGKPRWVWRRAIGSELKYRLGRLTRKPGVWMRDLSTASVAWGRLRADYTGSWERASG